MMLSKEETTILAVNQFLMAAEEADIIKIKASSEAQELAVVRGRILALFRQATASGNIDLMLSLERDTVEGCKDRYVNSRAMQRSLEAALVNIDTIQANADLIRDPSNDYRAALVMFAKRIKDGLPYDAGREALKSHYTQLVNLDKSNLSDEEKQIIEARQSLVRKVEDLYIALQENALGIKRAQNQKREDGQ